MHSDRTSKSNTKHTNSTESKLKQLLSACWWGYADGWSERRLAMIAESFRSGAAVDESTLTAVFNALDIDASRDLVNAIKLHLRTEEIYYPINVRDVEGASVPGDLRRIDTVLVAPPEHPFATPIFAEWKLSAAINGGRNYCKEHADYQNQLSCYVQDCCIAIPRQERFMIWIGPQRFVDLDPRDWGNKAITEKDVSKYSIQESFLDSQAIANWDAYVSLEELRDAAMSGNFASQLFGELLKNTIRARKL